MQVCVCYRFVSTYFDSYKYLGQNLKIREKLMV